MPRAATTTDVFNAIAESRRREIIEVLGSSGPQVVGALVEVLQIPQPAVSKHLSVLRQVGLVSVRRQGRERLYELNAKELKPVHDWVKTFEHYWSNQLDRIKARAERLARERAGGQASGDKQKGAS